MNKLEMSKKVLENWLNNKVFLIKTVLVFYICNKYLI